jgi:hypothetical protein
VWWHFGQIAQGCICGSGGQVRTVLTVKRAFRTNKKCRTTERKGQVEAVSQEPPENTDIAGIYSVYRFGPKLDDPKAAKCPVVDDDVKFRVKGKLTPDELVLNMAEFCPYGKFL